MPSPPRIIFPSLPSKRRAPAPPPRLSVQSNRPYNLPAQDSVDDEEEEGEEEDYEEEDEYATESLKESSI